MSTPYRGPDFDALAALEPDIAGVNCELVGSHPAHREPIRAG
jgi:hypothetical protein